MPLRNTIATYGSTAKFFHWLIFILLVCMLTFGYFLDTIPKDYQSIAYDLHKLTGLTILVLMLLRLIWKLSNPTPALPIGTPTWQRLTEQAVQFLLYVAIIAMPLAGWIGSAASGRPPHLGAFIINLPIAQNKGLSDTAFDVHNTLAVTIIVLISIHVLAALYHHFIKRDNLLRRILPTNVK